MKTILAIAIAVLIQAGASEADTLTFSGVITGISFSDNNPTNIYADIPTKVGDPFKVRIDFNRSLTQVAAFAVVGNYDAFWHAESGLPYFNGDLRFSLGPPVEFDAIIAGQGGYNSSDAWFGVGGNWFFGLSAQHFPFLGTADVVTVSGPVTKQNLTVPDTGDAAGMLGFSLLAIAATKYARRSAPLSN